MGMWECSTNKIKCICQKNVVILFIRIEYTMLSATYSNRNVNTTIWCVFPDPLAPVTVTIQFKTIMTTATTIISPSPRQLPIIIIVIIDSVLLQRMHCQANDFQSQIQLLFEFQLNCHLVTWPHCERRSSAHYLHVHNRWMWNNEMHCTFHCW